MRTRRLTALGLLAAFAALAPSPQRAAAALTGPTPPAPGLAAVADPLVHATALAGWLLLAWIAVLATLLAATRGTGLVARACGVVAAGLAPRAVRHALAVALGLSLVAGPTAAHAADGSTSGADWPTVSVPTTATVPPAPERPAPEPAPPTAPPPSSRPSAPAGYVVQPGDSLWSIAAEQLPPGTSAARIATTWPTWWSANRDRLGEDPDLIHPGTSLRPPPATKE